ncbi:uncharacterized protein BROUX77_002730 [Berkeleyomyces rouxiae]|uniref:uncharacterized protein n=1 Tax=Berkeleyomyces rouxiae TaxID=2035830 RepID=UPI003B7FB6FD
MAASNPALPNAVYPSIRDRIKNLQSGASASLKLATSDATTVSASVSALNKDSATTPKTSPRKSPASPSVQSLSPVRPSQHHKPSETTAFKFPAASTSEITTSSSPSPPDTIPEDPLTIEPSPQETTAPLIPKPESDDAGRSPSPASKPEVPQQTIQEPEPEDEAPESPHDQQPVSMEAFDQPQKKQYQPDAYSPGAYSQHAERSPLGITPPDSPKTKLSIDTDKTSAIDLHHATSELQTPTTASPAKTSGLDLVSLATELQMTADSVDSDVELRISTPSLQTVDFNSQSPVSDISRNSHSSDAKPHLDNASVSEAVEVDDAHVTTDDPESDLDEAVEDIIKRAVQKAVLEVDSEASSPVGAISHPSLEDEAMSPVYPVGLDPSNLDDAEDVNALSRKQTSESVPPTKHKSIDAASLHETETEAPNLETSILKDSKFDDPDRASQALSVGETSHDLGHDHETQTHNSGGDSYVLPAVQYTESPKHHEYTSHDEALDLPTSREIELYDMEHASERLILETTHQESRSRTLTPEPSAGLNLEIDQIEPMLGLHVDAPPSPSPITDNGIINIPGTLDEELERASLRSPSLPDSCESIIESPTMDIDYPLQDIPLSPDSSDQRAGREDVIDVSSSPGGSSQPIATGIAMSRGSAQLYTSISKPKGLEVITEGNDQTDGEETDEVDWEKLQLKEAATPKTPGDDDTTALLLARLEQENAKLSVKPHGVQNPDHQVPSSSQKTPAEQRRKSRPPSMAQLRKMVRSPVPQNLRYSQIEMPQMTDLEFYAAIVQDYQQAAARFPTLLSHKIRKGIPPPLRGVVWQSMAGARDTELEDKFDELCKQDSPYERIISKDLGRSFPGVDMFRDPDGEGQKKLGRVLKCLSVYDPKIGYCQGLAFVVGPLLMHMPDKQAFCVLVRLMEHYDLRSSYQPDLAGLHARIFQFRSLLQTMVPAVAKHLEDLQVEAAYVSQWFLSVFAVTCPLPMLFRMYDVLFAEGAHETLMRVALSLMKKNEARILACREMEDAMQLLLSRGLWDCYRYNADEFVDEFVALSDAVTREKLQALEEAYREQPSERVASAPASSASLSQTPRPSGSSNGTPKIAAVSAAASRFIGRIWAANYNPPNPGTQGPTSDPGAPTLTSPPDSNSAPTSPSQGDAGLRFGLGSGLGLGILTGTTGPPTGPGSTPTSSSSVPTSGAPSSTASTASEPPSAPVVPSAGNAKSSVEVVPASHPPPTQLPSSSSAGVGSNTLSPGPAPTSRPLSMLHRSASKQSLASTLNSMEAASNSSILSSASTTSTSTEATTVSISSHDSISVESTATVLPPATKVAPATAASTNVKSASILSTSKNQTDERYLHNQIEDLLAALTQLQLNHAILSSELEKERDEREEDKRAVQTFISGLRQQQESSDEAKPDAYLDQHADLFLTVEKRFALGDTSDDVDDDNKPAASPTTGMSKADLEDELRSAQDQMNAAKSQSQEFQRKIYALDNEVTSLRDQLKDSQTRMRTMHQDKQRMEKQLQTMRLSRGTAPTNSINVATGAAETIRNAFNAAAGVPGADGDKAGGSGLRELRLGRGPPSPSPSQTQFSRRASSVRTRDSVALSAATAAGATPTSEQDALLLQLVQAKTGEAMAKQEVEELRQKIDSLKKQYGVSDMHTPNRTNTAASAPVSNAGGGGGFWGGWRR